MTVVLHPPYFSLFLQLKLKVRDQNLDTTEVVEAESQEMLNILTEHDFQDVFKNGRSVENGAYEQKGATSKEMEASRPKHSY
jgi:hypothetical protein